MSQRLLECIILSLRIKMQQKHKNPREGMTHILQPQWFFTLLYTIYQKLRVPLGLSTTVHQWSTITHTFSTLSKFQLSTRTYVFNYFNDSMINPNLHVFNSDPLIVGEDRSWADRVEVDLCFDVDKKIEKIFDFVAFRRRIVVRCIGQACSFDLKNCSNKIVVKMSIKNTQLC